MLPNRKHLANGAGDGVIPMTDDTDKHCSAVQERNETAPERIERLLRERGFKRRTGDGRGVVIVGYPRPQRKPDDDGEPGR